MVTVTVYIYHENDIHKQKQYILKQSKLGSKFRLVGKIVKCTPKSTRTTQLMLLDIIGGELLIVDKDMIKELIPEIDIDLTIKNNKLASKYDNIQNYPKYVNTYTLYDESDKTKAVLVAVKVVDGNRLYSIMNTSMIKEFGDYKNAALTFYTEEELVAQVKSKSIQLINGKMLEDCTIDTRVDLINEKHN